MDDRLSQIQIRLMTQEDIQALADLEREVFSTPWSYDSIYEELSNPLAAFFVACDGAKPIGYIGMHYIIDEGYVTNIVVAPEYRRQGIARRLLRTALEFSEENALAFLSLEVRKSNDIAIDFYRSEDFEITGERKNFYTNPSESAYIMTRRL